MNNFLNKNSITSLLFTILASITSTTTRVEGTENTEVKNKNVKKYEIDEEIEINRSHLGFSHLLLISSTLVLIFYILKNVNNNKNESPHNPSYSKRLIPIKIEVINPKSKPIDREPERLAQQITNKIKIKKPIVLEPVPEEEEPTFSEYKKPNKKSKNILIEEPDETDIIHQGEQSNLELSFKTNKDNYLHTPHRDTPYYTRNMLHAGIRPNFVNKRMDNSRIGNTSFDYYLGINQQSPRVNTSQQFQQIPKHHLYDSVDNISEKVEIEELNPKAEARAKEEPAESLLKVEQPLIKEDINFSKYSKLSKKEVRNQQIAMKKAILKLARNSRLDIDESVKNRLHEVSISKNLSTYSSAISSDDISESIPIPVPSDVHTIKEHIEKVQAEEQFKKLSIDKDAKNTIEPLEYEEQITPLDLDTNLEIGCNNKSIFEVASTVALDDNNLIELQDLEEEQRFENERKSNNVVEKILSCSDDDVCKDKLFDDACRNEDYENKDISESESEIELESAIKKNSPKNKKKIILCN